MKKISTFKTVTNHTLGSMIAAAISLPTSLLLLSFLDGFYQKDNNDIKANPTVEQVEVEANPSETTEQNIDAIIVDTKSLDESNNTLEEENIQFVSVEQSAENTLATPITPVMDNSLMFHVVQSRETLWQIAQQYQLQLQELKQLNPQISDYNAIKKNQWIVIAPEMKVQGGIYYQIKPEDTLQSIAKKFNISVNMLSRYNPQIIDSSLASINRDKILIYTY